MMMYERLVKNLRDDTALQNCEFDFVHAWMHEAADAIEELLAERDEINADSWKRAYEVEHDEHRWIPVTERLPELNKVVQITDGIDVGHGYLASITSTQNMVYPSWHSPFCDVDETHITHWMLLPEPPEMQDVGPSKCDSCEIRQFYAKSFDKHWMGEDDCPFICDNTHMFESEL